MSGRQVFDHCLRSRLPSVDRPREDGMGFEEAMDAIARGVEALGIVTLVPGLGGSPGPCWAGAGRRPRCERGLPDRPNRVRAQHSAGPGVPGRGGHHQDRRRAALAGERRRLGADRADQDVPELLAGGRDRWPLAVAACRGCSVRVVDRSARHGRASRLVTCQAAGVHSATTTATGPITWLWTEPHDLRQRGLARRSGADPWSGWGHPGGPAVVERQPPSNDFRGCPHPPAAARDQ
jgi:hypothetical protein